MNKTLYLRNNEEVALWAEASRLLRFHRNQSVGEFCTEKLREYLHQQQKDESV